MEGLKKIFRHWTLALLLMLSPSIALAANTILPGPPSALSGPLGDPNQRVTSIVFYFINLLLLVTGVIAVLFIIIGGFRYITSAGNDELAESGKKTIQNAVIGLIIVILSYVIVAVISNALFGQT